LVLEEDGTNIDEDEALQIILEERCTLLLLCPGENYRPAGGILCPSVAYYLSPLFTVKYMRIYSIIGAY